MATAGDGADRPWAVARMAVHSSSRSASLSRGRARHLLVVLLGVPIVGQFVPDDRQAVIRYLPPEAAWALLTPDHDSLALPAAVGVLAGWVVLVLFAAAVTFQRRDV
ncbi:MAG TPA: hypothetical protein VFW65_13025 [Pseudonocardiaceae bacterium]|nr:hypothetical protein [Pseudonocardiaceae bacterium]